MSVFISSAGALETTNIAPSKASIVEIPVRIGRPFIVPLSGSFGLCGTRPARRYMDSLPCADAFSSLVEDASVVALENLLLRSLVESVEHRLPHVVDREVRLRVLRRHGVGAEEETVRV